MLHILFVLLKILLFLLLSMFLLALLVVVLLLFVPVRYRVHMQKEGNEAKKQNDLFGSIRMQINVHWLLHLIHAVINIRGKDVKVRVMLFGYPVIGRERRHVSRKRKKHQVKEDQNETEFDEKEEELLLEVEKFPEEVSENKDRTAVLKEEETIPTNQAKEKVVLDDLPEHSVFTEKEEASKQPFWSAAAEFIRSIFTAAKDFWIHIENRFRQIRNKLRNSRELYQSVKRSFAYYQRIWYDEHTVKAKKRCIKEIRYILRHYLPKMQKGELIFGLDDPALTGQVLGGICVLQGLTGNQMQIDADFERVRLEGDIVLKGHIRFFHLVKTALLLFFDKDIRVTVKRIRKIQGKPEK